MFSLTHTYIDHFVKIKGAMQESVQVLGYMRIRSKSLVIIQECSVSQFYILLTKAIST